jgi:type I restriction enzyme S subunit
LTEYETEFSEFPKDWEVRRLNEIVELQRGLSYSSKEKSKDEIPDGYLFLTLDSVKEGGGLKEDGWTWIKSDRLKEKHFVREGDLVIANTDIGMQRGRILGAPAIVRFPEWYKKDKAVFSHHITKLLLKVSNLDVNFLFYYLSFVQPLARKYHTGTTVWGLNVDSWAKDLLVPIPPLEEQKKIVEILNTVDFIITDTTNLIEKIKLLKEKISNLLITGSIWHKEFEDTEIGKIPKNWEIKKLKDIVIYRKGIKPKDLYIKKVNDNYLPYLTAEYLRDESEPKYVNPNENKIIVAEPEDILMIWDGSGAGDIFIGFKGAVASTFVCIKCNKNVIYPEYLYYYLLKKAETLKQRTKGTGIPHISKETFENLLVPIPPLEEQKKIVEILLTIDNKNKTETKYLDYMKKLKEKLLAALVTGKIRVNSIAIGDLR